MAKLSVGKAWEEAVVFVRREAHLLLPVALLFLALPSVIVGQMIPTDFLTAMAAPNKPSVQLPVSVLLALPLWLLLLQIGSLALYALALRPGVSVAEALNLAVRRIPVLIGVCLLLFLAMLVIGVAASIVGGIFVVIGGQALGVTLSFLLILPPMAYIAVRMSLLNVVIVDQGMGPIATLRASWSLTAGQFWRLFGFLIAGLLVGQILGAAVGSVFGIVGALIGGPNIATLFSGLAGGLVGTTVQVYMLVMLARLYRQATAA